MSWVDLFLIAIVIWRLFSVELRLRDMGKRIDGVEELAKLILERREAK